MVNFSNTITYVNQVLFSLLMLSQIFLMFAMTSIGRINEVLDEEPYLKETENPVHDVLDGSFSFNQVSFKYGQISDKYVLKDVNLNVESGSYVGIFGSTGTGKSTLVQLLARLITSGEAYRAFVKHYIKKKLVLECIICDSAGAIMKSFIKTSPSYIL